MLTLFTAGSGAVKYDGFGCVGGLDMVDDNVLHEC